MSRPSADAIRPSGVRILAVDDNPAALYATSRILKSAGFEVVEARTGSEALAKAEQVDLAILDVNLPDMDGFEVCRRLRSRPSTSHLPLLHLSATFTQTSDLQLGAEAGADSYLTRPVEPTVLIATVRTLLFARQADALRRSLDAKFRTVFELVPVGIAVLDARGTYTTVNPAFCQMTGYSAEDLVGQPVTYSVAASDFSLADVTEPKQPDAGRWIKQIRFRKKDGSTAELEWEIAHEQVSVSRILIATDVTLRFRNEEARESLLASERAARAEAERSNRIKEEFLATLSHELRNPLHAILGWATIINKTPNLPEQVVRGMQSIERNSKVQARMISDILDYAGFTFGRIRSVPENIDPYPVVRAALDVTAAAAQSSEIRIVADLEDVALRIDADPARLQQIIVNLLTNAVKFSSKWGEVRLSAGKSGGNFFITVADQGKGIEPHFLPRIFERFSQQDSSTTKSHGGLGLGLAIVKQLVDSHGGSVEAISEGKGKGATFKVLLPLSDSRNLDVSNTHLPRLRDFSKITALIVDDDADSRGLTARVLSDIGAQVIEADSAQSGIAAINESAPDILISDIGMSNIDGYQLLKTLREAGFNEARLPAIALTAFSRMEDRAHALAAGFQAHLVKPLDPQMLISAVANLCNPGPK